MLMNVAIAYDWNSIVFQTECANLNVKKISFSINIQVGSLNASFLSSRLLLSLRSSAGSAARSHRGGVRGHALLLWWGCRGLTSWSTRDISISQQTLKGNVGHIPKMTFANRSGRLGFIFGSHIYIFFFWQRLYIFACNSYTYQPGTCLRSTILHAGCR